MSQIQETKDAPVEAIEAEETVEVGTDELEDVSGGVKWKVGIEISGGE